VCEYSQELKLLTGAFKSLLFVTGGQQMNRVMLLIVGTLLTVLCAGTALAEDVVKTEMLAIPIKVTYTLPSQGAYECIKFNTEKVNIKKKKKTIISVIQAQHYGDDFTGVIRKEGHINSANSSKEVVSSIAYRMDTNIVKNTEKNSVTYTATKIITSEYTPSLFGSSIPIPTFEEDELISFMNNPIIGYTVEIKSEFKPDAIEGNFKKLAIDKYAQHEVILLNTKAVKATHLLDNKIYCYVVISPYRNGSKTTVSFEVPVVGGGSNVVDAAPQIDAVIKKLEAIVND
jgi:hypothetical protein